MWNMTPFWAAWWFVRWIAYIWIIVIALYLAAAAIGIFIGVAGPDIIQGLSKLFPAS